MKVLLLFPSIYSVDKTFKQGFEENGCSVETFDYRKHTRSIYEKIENKKLKLSNSLRNRWDDFYFKTINQAHLDRFKTVQPDLVLIYNNEMLLPETVKKFRETSKVVFFLGDSPYYSPTSKYNLQLLFDADAVLCPDTGWIEQLEMLGLDNLHHFVVTTGMEENFVKQPTQEELQKYGCDVVFIGGNVNSSWGYKRALFLNQFADMNFKLYGPPSWRNWFTYFPKLEKCLVPHTKGRLSFEEVNTIMNCAKIYPVDVNPGLVNGPHLRMYECFASGVLPLSEYRKDLDIIFKDIKLPVIHNYRDVEKITYSYVANDAERNKIIQMAILHIKKNYSAVNTVSMLFQILG